MENDQNAIRKADQARRKAMSNDCLGFSQNYYYIVRTKYS